MGDFLHERDRRWVDDEQALRQLAVGEHDLGLLGDAAVAIDGRVHDLAFDANETECDIGKTVKTNIQALPGGDCWSM